MTEKFAGGDFSVSCHAQDNLEMEQLTESFNSMVGEIAHLVDDIHTEQKNARDTELRLLQEQINPHFLYNTLDSITWMVEAKKNDEAVFMISKLAKLLRCLRIPGKIALVRRLLKRLPQPDRVQKFSHCAQHFICIFRVM